MALVEDALPEVIRRETRKLASTVPQPSGLHLAKLKDTIIHQGMKVLATRMPVIMSWEGERG